jgi:hypothetical protein
MGCVVVCSFAVVSLFRKSKQQLRDNMSNRRPHLVKALERIQDFYMELKWDFQSWGESWGRNRMRKSGVFKDCVVSCKHMCFGNCSAFSVSNIAVGYL